MQAVQSRNNCSRARPPLDGAIRIIGVLMEKLLRWNGAITAVVKLGIAVLVEWMLSLGGCIYWRGICGQSSG